MESWTDQKRFMWDTAFPPTLLNSFVCFQTLLNCLKTVSWRKIFVCLLKCFLVTNIMCLFCGVGMCYEIVDDQENWKLETAKKATRKFDISFPFLPWWTHSFCEGEYKWWSIIILISNLYSKWVALLLKENVFNGKEIYEKLFANEPFSTFKWI